MYHPFSVAETLKTAWDIFKKNFITIIVYSLITFAITFVVGLLIAILVPSGNFYVEMVASFIFLFIQGYTTLGLYKLIFTVIDSEYYEFEIKQVLPHITMILSYIAVALIIGFVIATYNIFILSKLDKDFIWYKLADYSGVVIGIYATIRIMFFNSFVVDDRSGPIESLKQSISLTKGNVIKIIEAMGLIIIIIVLLVLLYFVLAPLAIFLFFILVYPFVNILLIEIYRKLVYSHQDVDDDVTETV